MACVYDPYHILPKAEVAIELLETQEPAVLLALFPFWLALVLILGPCTFAVTLLIGTFRGIWESITARDDSVEEDRNAASQEIREEKPQAISEAVSEPVAVAATATSPPPREENRGRHLPNPFKEFGRLVQRQRGP